MDKQTDDEAGITKLACLLRAHPRLRNSLLKPCLRMVTQLLQKCGAMGA